MKNRLLSYQYFYCLASSHEQGEYHSEEPRQVVLPSELTGALTVLAYVVVVANIWDSYLAHVHVDVIVVGIIVAAAPSGGTRTHL